MPRVNWNAIEREEQAIENDEYLSTTEKAKRIAELHRDAREEYQEQQQQEQRDEFGW